MIKDFKIDFAKFCNYTKEIIKTELFSNKYSGYISSVRHLYEWRFKCCQKYFILQMSTSLAL